MRDPGIVLALRDVSAQLCDDMAKFAVVGARSHDEHARRADVAISHELLSNSEYKIGVFFTSRRADPVNALLSFGFHEISAETGDDGKRTVWS